MDERTSRAIAHLAEALYLLACVRNTDDQATIPVTVGENQIMVTPKTAEALADAIDSMNSYLAAEAPAEPAETTVDPVLVADLEEHCLGMDADFLMELAAQDPNKAVAAFDEIFEYAPAEQIMREDGDQL